MEGWRRREKEGRQRGQVYRCRHHSDIDSCLHEGEEGIHEPRAGLQVHAVLVERVVGVERHQLRTALERVDLRNVEDLPDFGEGRRNVSSLLHRNLLPEVVERPSERQFHEELADAWTLAGQLAALGVVDVGSDEGLAALEGLAEGESHVPLRAEDPLEDELEERVAFLEPPHGRLDARVDQRRFLEVADEVGATRSSSRG
eukprot:763237-Hanusia_phi.AAC.1